MTRYSSTMGEILSQIRGENITESHFKKGDEVVYKGMKGTVVGWTGEGDSEVYKIKCSDGKEYNVPLSQIQSAGSVEEGKAVTMTGKDGRKYDVEVQTSGNKVSFKVTDKIQKSFKTLTLGQAARLFEELELEEGKSSTGYELYHKDFSSAMQHAYDFAKKKFGITVDPKEIDDKVASGPRKPSKGKTNTYRLKGDKGAIHVQVYGMDNGKYELNMYKESVDLEEKFKVGDKVKVKKGTMKSPSQRHYEKTVGTIVKDYKDGDFKINFGGYDDLSIEGKFLVKESVELGEEALSHEMKVKWQRVGSELKVYGATKGGIDKKDFQDIGHMFDFTTRVKDAKDGYSSKEILNRVMDMDTDVRDKMMDIITKGLGTKWKNSRPTAKEIFGKWMNEEVELDEKAKEKVDPATIKKLRLAFAKTAGMGDKALEIVAKKTGIDIKTVRSVLEQLEEVELEEQVAAYDKSGKVVGLYKDMATAKKLKPNHTYKEVKEDSELEEKFGPMARQWQKGAKSVKMGDVELVKGKPGGVHTIKKGGKVVGDFSLDDNDLWVVNLNGVRGQGVLDDIDDILVWVKKSVKESIKEAAMQIAEKLKVSDGLGAWIDDFKKSDAPQFDGKSDEQKKKMAIAAFVDAGGKLEQKESVGRYSPLKQARLKKEKEDAAKKDAAKRNPGTGMREEEEPQKPDSAKAVEQGREDKKKTRIAQLQLQIAKAQETINKLNAQEK